MSVPADAVSGDALLVCNGLETELIIAVGSMDSRNVGPGLTMPPNLDSAGIYKFPFQGGYTT